MVATGRSGCGCLTVRFGISALGFGGIGLVGFLFVTGASSPALATLLPVIVLSLVVAVRNTWDLLVTVAARTDSDS